MRKTTIILIIAFILVGLYAVNEVNYYSQKAVAEQNTTNPLISIPKIGINENINNQSVSRGVYHENDSYEPTQGEVVLFGHRTLSGSPFLRLNELSTGDIVTLEWPGIGELNYTITNSSIVPGDAKMEVRNDDQKLYLITCHPIGSTEDRLIYEANLTSQGEINYQNINSETVQQYGLIICIGFLVIGLTLTYFYYEADRIYLLLTVLIMSAILFYAYFSPGSFNELTSYVEMFNQMVKIGA